MAGLFLYCDRDLSERRIKHLQSILISLAPFIGTKSEYTALLTDRDGYEALEERDQSALGSFLQRDLIYAGGNFKQELQQAVKASFKLKREFTSEPALSSFTENDAVIFFKEEGAGLYFMSAGKVSPLIIDFESVSYRQRLLRGGRRKEAVARAVLQGVKDDALIFDATAGLGRESMILAHAGGRVVSFERQLPVWFILKDALLRAEGSGYLPFTLPELQPIGTITDRPYTERPEVVYYDPMFPEKQSSAQVKKDMFIFRNVVGHDEDTVFFIREALKLAKKRVTVKRPDFAPVLEDEVLKCSYSVDGGQCRFDCYTV